METSRPGSQRAGREPTVATDARAQPEEVRDVLTRAVSRSCRSWPAEVREDLVQNALVRVLAQCDGPRELPRSYLWKVAHSVVADELRRRRRRPETVMEEPPEVVAPPDSSDPRRAQSLRELGEAVRDCLGGLIDSRRAVVQLYLLGHDAGEIAGLTGDGSKRTRNLLFRGLSDLRACLRQKGFAP